MIGVTLFGLIFTPIFYIVVRGLVDRSARIVGADGQPEIYVSPDNMHLHAFEIGGVQYALAAPYPDPSQVDEDVYA